MNQSVSIQPKPPEESESSHFFTKKLKKIKEEEVNSISSSAKSADLMARKIKTVTETAIKKIIENLALNCQI